MSKNNAFLRLCGVEDMGEMARTPALRPFHEGVIAFLADLSAALLRDPAAKAYPDVVTFAFFCRKAHLFQLRQEYEGALEDRLGRGLVFHIAPGNVPINFAYSLVAALLAGNASLVKASSQDFAQTRMVCAAMEKLLSGAHTLLRPYVNVITYPREEQTLTEQCSALCDVRVIWGGDETVGRVREAALSPLAFDVTFADRYSLLCVQPEAVLSMDEEQLAAMAQGFYNDTFLSDQNACTAPRLVYWCPAGPADGKLAPGRSINDSPAGPADGGPAGSGLSQDSLLQQAQTRFWQAVHAYAAPRYPVEPVIAVDKLTALYRAAIALPGARRVPMPDNLIARIHVDALDGALLDFRCPGGCFVEYASETLDGLKALAGRKVQTLSYLGVNPEELWQFMRENGGKGIDRIVPIGKTMDFSLTWDGYDLIRTLSRRVQTL